MRGFYIILTSIIVVVHFWRFPYLVMENGGGAFLMLYLLCLFGLALPVFIAEMSFEKIFGQRRNSLFMLQAENLKKHLAMKYLLRGQLILQILIWVGLFQYFVYIASLALIYFRAVLFARDLPMLAVADVHPQLLERFAIGSLLFVLVGLTLKKRLYFGVIRFFRWMLPFCLMVFVVILFQILSVGSHYEGVKTMLYPDFYKLRWASLLEATSHGFLSLALGMGWQKLTFVQKMKQDLVSIAINVASLSALVGVFSGLLAIPMVEQVSEKAFGANWLFYILPRWLLYGQFGAYYCGLFFMALFMVAFFLCTQAQYLFTNYLPRRHWLSRPWVFLGFNGLVSSGLIFLFYLKNRWALWEQSLILMVDRVFVDFMLPLNAVLTVGFLFAFASRKQRKKVILDQKIFYNSEMYFRYWQFSCLWGLPAVLLLGWCFVLVKAFG